MIISLKRIPALFKFSTFSEKDCIPTKLLAFNSTKLFLVINHLAKY